MLGAQRAFSCSGDPQEPNPSPVWRQGEYKNRSGWDWGGSGIGKDISNPPSTGILTLNTQHLWHKRAGCSNPEEAPGGRRRAGGVQEGGLNYPGGLSRAKT